MPYDIYVLGENDLTISGGGQLDGVTQGDGSHLDGLTITLNSNAWSAISVDDNDANFQDSDTSQRLDGAQSVNGTTYADNTVVEAEYGLTLSDGTNTWTVVGFNVNNSSPAYATVEGLAFIGGPGGFPPVGVPLTVVNTFEGPSFAAADYATPICFAHGTLIDTPIGPRRVEDIAVGDPVLTESDGPQPVRWRAHRRFVAEGRFAPVRFAIGSIGNTNPLIVSPQHRIAVTGWRAQMICGEDAVLVPAKCFVDGRGVTRVTGGWVTYHHLMFDRHQIVFAEGVATESFHPGDVGIGGMDAPVRDELLAMFPELSAGWGAYGPAALRDVRGNEARVLLAA